MDNDLQNALNLINSGQKKEGGQLLTEFVKRHPENETAWLWLAYCVNTNKQKIYCLDRALNINPRNEIARKELEQLQGEDLLQFTDNNPLKHQTNTFAIISLISSFLGWVFGLLFFVFLVFAGYSDAASYLYLFMSLLAFGIWTISIVAGTIGLRQIKTHSSQRGDGLAKSGIIISGIGCGMILCIFAIIILGIMFVLY